MLVIFIYLFIDIDLQNQQKHFKSEDNACNKNSKTVQKDKVIMQNFDTMGKSKDKTAQKEINNVWLKVRKHTLHDNDKADIENRKMLNDTIIDAAQFLMKKQFTNPKIKGFQSVLNKQRVTSFKKVENDMIQILHRGSPGIGHWLTISNLNCQEGTVNVFDSFYNDIDKESKLQIANILKPTGKNIKFNSNVKPEELNVVCLPLPLQ